MKHYFNIDPQDLLTRLESHWQPKYQANALHEKISHSLKQLKKELARDNDEARMVMRVYRKSLHEELSPDELQQANQALEHIIADLGLFILATLPLGFVTLPTVIALARHFDIDLGLSHSEEQNLLDDSDQ